MKRKSWKSRIFALALTCSMIMSSAGVVLADESGEIFPEPVAEEMMGETSEEVLTDPATAPELEIPVDENVVIPDVVEEDSPVIDQPAEQEIPNQEVQDQEPQEIVIEEPEAVTETEEVIPTEEGIALEELIPADNETVIEEEELIVGEPETDLDILFESARTELDQLLTTETEVFSRIQTIYTWVSQAFPDALLTDEELALLTQRLMENYGIQSCVISGWDENGEQVFWNLVQLDDVFFNLDVSQDRGATDQQQWTGFLKGGAAPFGYVRDEAFTAEAFTAAYLMSEEDYVMAQEEEEQTEVSEAAPEEVDAASEEVEVVSEEPETVPEENAEEAEAVQEEENKKVDTVSEEDKEIAETEEKPEGEKEEEAAEAEEETVEAAEAEVEEVLNLNYS